MLSVVVCVSKGICVSSDGEEVRLDVVSNGKTFCRGSKFFFGWMKILTILIFIMLNRSLKRP
jgi:hypothetical protein